MSACACAPRLHAILLLFIVVIFVPGAIADADTPSTTTTPPYLSCLRANSIGDPCNVQSICIRCVHTDGCAFDVLTGDCMPMPPNGTALYVSSSNSLLNRTNLSYCGDSDPKCALCTVSSTTPFCEGLDGCVCPSFCATQHSQQLLCFAQLQSNVMYITVAVLAVAVPLVLMFHRLLMRRRRQQGTDLQAERRRMRVQRQRQHTQHQPGQTLTLQLESWRQHRDQHNVTIDKVEPLQQCYVLMETDTTSGRTEEASTASSVNGIASLPTRQTQL